MDPDMVALLERTAGQMARRPPSSWPVCIAYLLRTLYGELNTRNLKVQYPDVLMHIRAEIKPMVHEFNRRRVA